MEKAGAGGRRAFLSSRHWRIGKPSRAAQGNQRRRRAGRDQWGRRREERGQFDLPISFPVYQAPLQIQQPLMFNRLTLSRGVVGWAPLRALTVHGLLPRGGYCHRLSHLVWRVRLNFRGDPLLSCLALRWLVDHGGKWLSVICGLGLMFRTAERWWTGLWVRSGSGEIIHGAAGGGISGGQGDPRGHHRKKKTLGKNRNKTEDKHTEVTVFVRLFCPISWR